MKQYAEYFIGGPMDGREKTKEFPSTPEWGVVRAIDFLGDPPQYEDLAVQPMDIEWDYRQGKFVFGGIVIKFWTDARLISREVIACRLAELIMAPHIEETRATKVNLTKGTPQ